MTYSIIQICIMMALVVFLPMILGFVEHFFFIHRYHRHDRAFRSVFEVLTGSRLISYAIVLDATAFYFFSLRWGNGTEVVSPFFIGFLILIHFQLFILSLIVERRFHQYKDTDFKHALCPARIAFSLGLLSLLTNGFIVNLIVKNGGAL